MLGKYVNSKAAWPGIRMSCIAIAFGEKPCYGSPMNLMTYIADSGRRAKLAADCGTSPQYLWQIATGWNGRRAGKALAILIEDRTGGIVSRHELRDDLSPSEAKPE